MANEGHLCVGGPWAGRRVAHDGIAFGLNIARHSDVNPAIVTTDPFEYKLVHFTFEHNPFTIWVPRDQSAKATMELLLAAYERTRVQ